MSKTNNNLCLNVLRGESKILNDSKSVDELIKKKNAAFNIATISYLSLTLDKDHNDRLVSREIILSSNRENTVFDHLNITPKTIQIKGTMIDKENFTDDIITVKMSKAIFDGTFNGKDVRLGVNHKTSTIYKINSNKNTYELNEDGEVGRLCGKYNKNNRNDELKDVVAYDSLFTTSNASKQCRTYFLNSEIDRMKFLELNCLGITNVIEKNYADCDGKVNVNDIASKTLRISLLFSSGRDVKIDDNTVFELKEGSYLDPMCDRNSDGVILCRESYLNLLLTVKNSAGLAIQGRIKVDKLNKGNVISVPDVIFDFKFRQLQQSGVIDNTINSKDFNFLTDTNSSKIELSRKINTFTLMTAHKSTPGHLNKQIINKITYASIKCGIQEEISEYLLNCMVKSMTESFVNIYKDEELQLSNNYNPFNLLDKASFNSPSTAYNKIYNLANNFRKTIDKLSVEICDNKGSLIYNTVIVGDMASILFGIKVLKEDEFFSNVRKDKDEMAAFKNPSNSIFEVVILKRVDATDCINRLRVELEKTGMNKTEISDLLREFKITLNNFKGTMLPNNPDLFDILAGLDFDGDKIICVFCDKLVEVLKSIPKVKISIKPGNKFTGGMSKSTNNTFMTSVNDYFNNAMKAVSNDRYLVNSKEMFDAVTSRNLSAGLIGLINNYCEKCIAVLFGVLTEKKVTDEAVQLLKERFGTTAVGGNKCFKTLFEGLSLKYNFVWDSNFIYEMNNIMRESNWNDLESVILYLEMLTIAYRHDTEGAIDSANKGYTICCQNPIKSISIQSAKTIVLELDASGTPKIKSSVQKVYKVKRQELDTNSFTMKNAKDLEIQTIAYKDPTFFLYQEKLIDIFNNLISNEIAKRLNEFSWDEKIISKATNSIDDLLSRTFTYLDEDDNLFEITGSQILQDIKTIKVLFDASNSEIRSRRNEELSNGYKTDEEKEDIYSSYRLVTDERNTKFRTLFVDLLKRLSKNEEKFNFLTKKNQKMVGAILHYVSLLDYKGDVDNKSRNSFATVMSSNYHNLFLFNGDILAYGNALRPIDASLIGTTVTLDRGWSDTVKIKEDYTGEVLILSEDKVQAKAKIKSKLNNFNSIDDTMVVSYLFDTKEEAEKFLNHSVNHGLCMYEDGLYLKDINSDYCTLAKSSKACILESVDCIYEEYLDVLDSFISEYYKKTVRSKKKYYALTMFLSC